MVAGTGGPTPGEEATELTASVSDSRIGAEPVPPGFLCVVGDISSRYPANIK